ncbi:hypothetical protein POSPLADRAFT_1034477 [Postia placenta MAD-698-R-SB12]|uniref:Uncharacterized protein n=1 Tax=Postia placenta MAD-698-R-SB12 TaxID=670580 RepID=A0A1X6MX03_9APHY|nr:hypothetical protein POSPLADRAFT_1034477 [Postia placenta MAD-698-R-SB12]OSX60905.1 hypothetical protein POSPLADRAFT_1034477 [Postia placenta MAD-698-R-SB12]
MAALATFGRSSISHLSATDQIAHTVPSASVGVCMELLVCTIKPMGEARLCIRVLPSGRFSFDVQPSALAEASNSGIGGFSSLYSVVFETLDDGEAHILRVYTTLNSGHAQAANHYQGASEGSNASGEIT